MGKIDSVYQELDSKHPKLVFLNGKTSTGKTTLSNTLKERYDCAVVELDSIIYGLESRPGTNRFIEAYQKRDDVAFTDSFVTVVQQKVREALRGHAFVIIEGAIVNNDTLREIIDDWADSFLFIYLDIQNVDVYMQRLTNRFMLTTQDDGNGLPGLFWDKFSPEVLQRYYATRTMMPDVENAIRSYAVDSIKESAVRLTTFSSKFDHILKVEV
jgi:shikimate kinase